MAFTHIVLNESEKKKKKLKVGPPVGPKGRPLQTHMAVGHRPSLVGLPERQNLSTDYYYYFPNVMW